MQSRRAALLLIAAAAVVALVHALWISQVTDDAGISLAYARDLARGEGLRLTPLSPRVEAFSDPLWVLWLAAGFALRLDGPGFAHVCGAVCAAAAAFVVGLVPSRAEGRAPRALDAVAPWVLALDTTYAVWGGAGLETGAFALALAAAMALVDRGPWSAIPAGLLSVLRPEGPLYVVALAPVLARHKVPQRSRALDAIAWLALAALPVVLWTAFRRGYYGQWLPNSYYAKARWDYGGWRYLAAWFTNDRWHYVLCAFPLALAAARTRRTALLAALACAAGAAFVIWSRGDWMEEHRFVAHALPAAALAAALVPAAFDALRLRRVVVAAAAVALLGLAAWDALVRSPARKANPVFALSYVAEQGRWFRDRARSLGLTGYRLAHFDLGGTALESGAEVIDLAGLADLYIGRVGYQAQQQVRDYLLEEVRPDMINVHGPCAYLKDDPRFARDYRLEASGLWGENYVRSSLALNGVDERCPPDALPRDLAAALQGSPPARGRDLWLCARAHLPAKALPDVSALAARLAAQGMRDGDENLLDAAVTLDPLQTAAAQRLLRIRLSRGR